MFSLFFLCLILVVFWVFRILGKRRKLSANYPYIGQEAVAFFMGVPEFANKVGVLHLFLYPFGISMGNCSQIIKGSSLGRRFLTSYK
jgi:hypothetical protein